MSTDPYEVLRRWIFVIISIIGVLLTIVGALVQGIGGLILMPLGTTIVILAIWGLVHTRPRDGL